MKHGLAFRKFSRTSSHRNLMLRNLVTSLFEHEQITTTLPKARDAARLAEKIITLGKKGDIPSYRRAQSFVLNTTLLPKIFGTFASRYSSRPGGYTRIHKFVNRRGDNAPTAILELVDNPRDLKVEMTARAVGKDILDARLQRETPGQVINRGVTRTKEVMEKELSLGSSEAGELRPRTRWNLQKVMKYRGNQALSDVGNKATLFIENLLAKPLQQHTSMTRELAKRKASDDMALKPSEVGKLVLASRAGVALPGEKKPAMKLVQGALGRPSRPRKKGPIWFRDGTLQHAKSTVLSMRTVYK